MAHAHVLTDLQLKALDWVLQVSIEQTADQAPGLMPDQVLEEVAQLRSLVDLLPEPGQTHARLAAMCKEIQHEAQGRLDVLRAQEEAEARLETPKMLVISTHHISRQTAELFDLKIKGILATHEREALPQVYAKGEYGYLLPLVDEPEDRKRYARRIDLLTIRSLAEDKGCTWIMLDRDADTVDGLLSFDW